jgi:ABC-type phosphate transport system substrate-binding protein
MKKLKIAFFFCLFTGIGSLSCLAQALDGFVVAGNKTGLTTVNKKQLARIFQGRESIWKTGEEVVLVMPSAKSESGGPFAEKVLNMSYTALQKYWLVLVFQGRASAPVFLNSNAEMLDYIKRNPGAIGVLKMPEKEVDKDLIIPVSEN